MASRTNHERSSRELEYRKHESRVLQGHWSAFKEASNNPTRDSERHGKEGSCRRRCCGLRSQSESCSEPLAAQGSQGTEGLYNLSETAEHIPPGLLCQDYTQVDHFPLGEARSGTAYRTAFQLRQGQGFQCGQRTQGQWLKQQTSQTALEYLLL